MAKLTEFSIDVNRDTVQYYKLIGCHLRIKAKDI